MYAEDTQVYHSFHFLNLQSAIENLNQDHYRSADIAPGHSLTLYPKSKKCFAISDLGNIVLMLFQKLFMLEITIFPMNFLPNPRRKYSVNLLLCQFTSHRFKDLDWVKMFDKLTYYCHCLHLHFFSIISAECWTSSSDFYLIFIIAFLFSLIFMKIKTPLLL